MENGKQVRKKRIRRRRFVQGELHHIYQRTIMGFNIFYDLEDYLVYYTIFATAVRQYGVVIWGLCLMYDHIHMLMTAESKVMMSEFIRQVTSMFAREQNNDTGRKGSLFQSRFGSASKIGLKKIRTAIAYLFNNPVEKNLCHRAEEYRWNFLAYAKSKYPFSEMISLNKASAPLRKALKEVDICESQNRHLRYMQVRRMFGKLELDERMQLLDYIISKYNPINYEELIGCYSSYEDMLIAINSNTGSEYDIKETRYAFSDVEYESMINVLRNVEGIKEVRQVTAVDLNEKIRLFGLLRRHVSCSNMQIAKFLHLELDGGGD